MINTTQRWVLLAVVAGLIGWLIWYWWMLPVRRHHLVAEPVTADNEQDDRLDRALGLLRRFQQQPTLNAARLNFLRQLAFADLHDLVLLALSAVNYIVRMDQPALSYELPGVQAAIADSELLIDVQESALPIESTRRGRLTRSVASIMDNKEPVVESGNLFTVEGQTVLLSIQVDGESYSRYGLARLAESCTLEDLPGMLIYLGTTPATKQLFPQVVVLPGTDLLSILDGLASQEVKPY